jgi:hypothetical protein
MSWLRQKPKLVLSRPAAPPPPVYEARPPLVETPQVAPQDPNEVLFTQTLTAAPSFAATTQSASVAPPTFVPSEPQIELFSTVPPTTGTQGGYLPTATFYSNDGSYFALAGEVNPLPTDPTFNSITVTTLADVDQLTVGSGAIDLKLGTQSNLLEAIAAVPPLTGTDLFFDGQLLAKASDIQDIADWALYPAIGNVNMDARSLVDLSSITWNGPTGTVMTVGLDAGNPSIIEPTVVLNPGAGEYGVLRDWAAYPATLAINGNGQSIYNLAADGLGNAVTLTSGVIKLASTDLFDSTAGVATINTVPIASQWSAYKASQAVDLSGNNLIEVADISQNVGGIANLQTLNVAATSKFLGTVDLSGNNLIGVLDISQNVGGVANLKTLNVAGASTFLGNLDLSGSSITNATQIGIRSNGVNGVLTTDTSGTVLRFNGATITTGTGGDVSQWSTFPVLPTQSVVSTGTDPLRLGNQTAGTVINGTVTTLDTSNLLATIDGGLIPFDTADISLTATGGDYGNVTIQAQPGALNPVPPISGTKGGLVTIEALSGSSILQGLSRVNVDAATVTIQSGAASLPVFVPGSVNLLAGAGSGIQLLTGTGVINSAAAATNTMSGGAGCFLNGASTGVQVSGGNLKITNGNRLATDEIGTFTGGGSVGCVSPMKIPQLVDGANSFGTIGQIPTATGAPLNAWTWAAAAGGTGSVGTIFVSTTGNDTTGNGSATSPYATIAKALTVAAAIVDSTPVAINLFAGTFTESPTITRANTYINGQGAVAQECYINGVVTWAVNTSTLAFILGGMSGVRMNRLACAGTPVVQVDYNFINCVMTSGSGVIPFDGSQGGAVTYNVVFDGCTFSPTDTRAAGVIGVTCSFLRCLLSVLTQNSVIFVDIDGVVNIYNSQMSSSYTGTNASPILQIRNTAVPPASHIVSQSRLFYTSTVTDITGSKCCIRFINSAAVSMTVDNCFFNCVGAIAGAPLTQCIQRTGAGTVALSYGNIQAVSPAIWINPTITRTVLSSVQQGVNAVGGAGVPGVGAGDYLAWDGNQWASGSTTVSLGRGAGNTADVTCVNIGQNAGTGGNTNGVAIGNGAGTTTTTNNTIAIGQNAGQTASQGAIAIGSGAGIGAQINSICIGNNGVQALGPNSIMIGTNTGIGGTTFGTGSIILNATGNTVNPPAGGCFKVLPMRNASAIPSTFTAQTRATLSYNFDLNNGEVTYDNTSFKCSVITAPSTLALNPTVRGSTYIVTGTGTLTITNTLVAGDNGFFVYLKNGTTGTPADITLAGVAGATTLHQPTGSQNGQVVVLFWASPVLTAY